MQLPVTIRFSREMCDTLIPAVKTLPEGSLRTRLYAATFTDRKWTSFKFEGSPPPLGEGTRMWPRRMARELLEVLTRTLDDKSVIMRSHIRKGLEWRVTQLEVHLNVGIIDKIAKLDPGDERARLVVA
jgi:hypothetical protein